MFIIQEEQMKLKNNIKILGNKQEETKVEIKDKPAPDKKEITLDTIVDDLKTEAINEDQNRIFVSDLPPIKQEDIVPNQQIIYPKKKPVPENIIILKEKTFTTSKRR